MGVTMGLFKRRDPLDDDATWCPVCRERVPDGADVCQMYGAPLANEPTATSSPGGQSVYGET